MSAQRPRPGLLFLLLNVRGLTGCKLVHLISWLKEKRVDVAVFTETQLSSSPDDLLKRLPGAGALWPGARVHHCPGTGHTEGVAIVLGPRCNALSPALFQDIQGGGRLLRIDFTIEAQPVALVAVYAPAQADLRRGFYRDAVRSVLPTDGRPLLLVGDFNCVLDSDDCVYAPGSAGPSTNSLHTKKKTKSASLVLSNGAANGAA